jgi:hypothetical protein
MCMFRECVHARLDVLLDGGTGIQRVELWGRCHWESISGAILCTTGASGEFLFLFQLCGLASFVLPTPPTGTSCSSPPENFVCFVLFCVCMCVCVYVCSPFIQMTNPLGTARHEVSPPIVTIDMHWHRW